ncbi:unnamed protein product [Rotaria socialis]|uniref:Uncharacterized protein n=1 Tax=Rotaria socialis TaxID=392032 RepID=A0A817XZ31_9BILA|nr:unnamed protein product [Rotaria socialis]CAF3329464.1 unnamed protein product [Rotaria socialis]CAF3374013.1 unnamed protein product [Rotaria socialis]CAF3578186.1 unnamed protein product [Rotaria socialis]CAF4250623.1 unnamed protein product [Rotaria socialis]
MKDNPESTYINMSAYVALSCLIAFIIVITICLVKQFIWDPLLSKRFEVLRPVLSESVRKFSTSFYRASSITIPSSPVDKSMSQSCIKQSEPPLLTNNNFITVRQNLPSTDNQLYSITTTFPRRSYGSSSFNSFAYTNLGAEDLQDEKLHIYPTLHFSCEYNPSTFSIRLNVQNLRNMNSLLTLFDNTINRSAYMFLRFVLSTTIAGEPYETSLQNFQDFIRFGETFNILSNIRAGDILNCQIKFFLMLLTDKDMYELGEANYSMKDDQLTHILYIERILPIRVGKKLKSATSDDNNEHK